jgi:hypothetical protein
VKAPLLVFAAPGLGAGTLMLPVRWPTPPEPPLLLVLWKTDPLLLELELSPLELELLPLEELEELEELVETAAPPVPLSAPRCCAEASPGDMTTQNATTMEPPESECTAFIAGPPSLVLYYRLEAHHACVRSF